METTLIPSLRRAASLGTITGEGDSIDDWVSLGLPRAKFHELFALDPEDGAAASGFAVALSIVSNAVPMLWIRTAEAERRGGRLLGAGFTELGLSPSMIVVVLVDDEIALLRAAADAARCPGLGTLVIESRGRAARVDLTATRRLMLAAETSGVTILSLRLGADPTPSAAATRWSIAGLPSTPLPANAPGRPGFAVELLRRRGGPAGARWCLEWNRDAKTFTAIHTPLSYSAPLSGTRIPLAVDRPAADHSRASLRRTG